MRAQLSSSLHHHLTAPHASNFRLLPITLAVLSTLAGSHVAAQPAPTQLPVVRPGSPPINATIAPTVGVANPLMTINQDKSRAVIEWSSFGIGSAAKVNIVQPNAQSVLINRVTGNGEGQPSASQIYGGLSANGRVFLINPSGILFGPGAQVNTGSLVTSTLDLSDTMTANKYERLLNGNTVDLAAGSAIEGGSLRVAGAEEGLPAAQIQVTQGGSIVLVSRSNLSQEGSLSAPGGSIHLAAAQNATVTPVGQSGFVQLLTARSPATAYAPNPAIGITGHVSTDSSTGSAGEIQVDAGANGSVRVEGNATVSASSTAAGASGGKVTLQGRDIAFNANTDTGAAPRVAADGASGGGSIAVGNADTRAIMVAPKVVFSVDATDAGNGGSIAVRAMYNEVPASNTTATPRVDFGVAEIYGDLLARGGTRGGNGGQIETSAAALTTSLRLSDKGPIQSARIDASARATGGMAGTWTLDPFDVTISTAPSSAVNGSFNPTGPGANVSASDISTALNAGTNVDISTAGAGTEAGNITLATGTAITRSSGAAATSLTLRANDSITLGTGSSITSTAGLLNVNLYSDLDGNNTGSINLQTAQMATAGGSVVLSGGANPATGYARGSLQQFVVAGVSLNSSSIDTSGATSRGDVTIRGASLADSGGAGVSVIGSNITAHNINITGQANQGTAVEIDQSFASSTFTPSVFDTASGLIDIRGVATRSSANQSPNFYQAIGVDIKALDVVLGTGSLYVAGRADDNSLSTAFPVYSATGLQFSAFHVKAAASSTGTITLAGQAVGSPGPGVTWRNLESGNLEIDSGVSGSIFTGANIIIGGQSSGGNALNIGSSALAIQTTGAANLRPLGVSTTGALTELPTTSIVIGSTPAAGSFTVDPTLLRRASGTNGGISADQGLVIGSSTHTGSIALASNALTSGYTDVSLTLQNQGAGSAGIALGSGNTLRDLSLLSAGNITQSGGITVVRNLTLQGGAASNFDLSAAGNTIGNLAFDPPNILSVLTQGDLTVGAANTAIGYNTATSAFSPLSVTDSQAGNQALLRSAAGNVLINRSIAMTDAGASQLDIVSNNQVIFAANTNLTTSATGRARVWAASVVNPPASQSGQNLYGCVFGDTSNCSVSGVVIPTTGNQVLRPTRPTLTVAVNATGFTGNPLPTLTPVVTGLVNGDTAEGALTGSVATSATSTSPAGTYAVTQGTLSSPTGYILAVDSDSNVTLNVGNADQRGITRQMLQTRYLAELSSDVYGKNLAQPQVCTAASLIRDSAVDDSKADPLASEWGKVRNQPQLSGCLTVSDGGQCSAF